MTQCSCIGYDASASSAEPLALRRDLGSRRHPVRMSGEHEPPTNRSFYLSVATSTLRFAIIVALVVGGVVVIGKAFPSSGGVALSPTPNPTHTPKSPPAPDLKGVEMGVYNGTSAVGLAGDTATKLIDQFEVKIPDANVGDAPSTVATTTIYYRGGAQGKVNAQELRDKFFTPLGVDAKLARLQSDSSIKKSIQLAVYLGTDYASSQTK